MTISISAASYTQHDVTLPFTSPDTVVVMWRKVGYCQLYCSRYKVRALGMLTSTKNCYHRTKVLYRHLQEGKLIRPSWTGSIHLIFRTKNTVVPTFYICSNTFFYQSVSLFRPSWLPYKLPVFSTEGTAIKPLTRNRKLADYFVVVIRNIRTLPHFHINYDVSLYCDFVLHSAQNPWIYTVERGYVIEGTE